LRDLDKENRRSKTAKKRPGKRKGDYKLSELKWY
jgi:hypothetical protein